MALKAYYGISIVLVDGDPHQLLPLLVAADPSLAELLQNVAALQIQADDSNDDRAAYIGDSEIDAAEPRYAFSLLVHEANPYRSFPIPAGIPLGAMWVQAPDATEPTPVQLNLEIIL